jgi:EmrB/QacA subfamily drug resistance transporter
MSAYAASATSSPAWRLALLSAAQFMVVLDITVVTVALPAIGDDLDLSPTDLSWVVNAYTIALGGFLLLGGRASDIFGRRRVFLAGVGLFTLGSLGAGLAPSGGALIGARAVQGLGAALLSPAALALLLAGFAEGPERNRALAVWAAVAGAGTALGLVVGGALTEAVTWEAIFLINVPVGLVVAPLVLRHVRESRSDTATRLDAPGAVLATAGLAALIYGIVRAEEHGFGSGSTLGWLAAGLVLLAGFALVESRVAQPLVRLSVFRLRSLRVADSVYLITSLGMFGPVFLLSLYLQLVLDATALETGLAFLPWAVAFVVVASLAPRIVARHGVKPPLLVGLVLGSLSLVLLGFIRPDGSFLVDVLPASLVMAVGFGLVLTPLTIAATANLPTRDAGLAAGLFNSAQEVGAALGVALFVSISTSITDDRLREGADPATATVDGYQLAFLIGAALVLVAALASAAWLHNRDVPRVAPAGAGAH